jgi:hypothetical protein
VRSATTLSRGPAALLAILIIVNACSSTPPAAKKAKEPARPPEALAGQYAFYQMFNAARGWIPDVQAVSLTSLTIPEVASGGGRYGAWRAVFVSQSRGRQRMYTFSAAESPSNTVYKGVFAGHEETYAGPRGQAKPFLAVAIKIDSPAAFETAMKKGADYAKKFPNTPISMLVELTPRFPNPVWRVVWGESVGTSNYSIYVDASTGEYLQTMR